MKVVLISTYELGHQPFGLASPAAWLRARARRSSASTYPARVFVRKPSAKPIWWRSTFRCTRPRGWRYALIEPVRRLNRRAHLCFYGLYAPVNEAYLRELGVETIMGGEFEATWRNWSRGLRRAGQAGRQRKRHRVRNAAARSGCASRSISLDRLNFIPPDRAGLPPLREYAHLLMPEGRIQGRGLHGSQPRLQASLPALSRSCRSTTAFSASCSAKWCWKIFAARSKPAPSTSPSAIPISSTARPTRWPSSRRCTANSRGSATTSPSRSSTCCEHCRSSAQAARYRLPVRHQRRRVGRRRRPRAPGKGHTRADFLAVVRRFRELGLVLQPTFVPFTPWTTLAGYRDLLECSSRSRIWSKTSRPSSSASAC